MPTYVIDVATRDPTHDYAGLWQAMRSAKAHRCFDATWLLDIDRDLQTITDSLAQHCVAGDCLLVVELASLTRWSGTGLSDDTVAWLAARTLEGKLDPAPPSKPSP